MSNETGHAKNLENMKKVREFAASWNARYQPSNSLLLLPNINLLVDEAENTLDATQSAKTVYRNAAAAAHDAFEPLSEMMTRVMKALKVSGVADSIIEDAKTYTRKIKGQRAAAKPETDPASPQFNPSAKANSVSQMSRVQRIENLDALILLLVSQPAYKPNETELRTASLSSLSSDLKAKADAVQAAFVELSNRRGARDAILYTQRIGLIYVGRLFKEYVESFGRRSLEWSQVKNIMFEKIGHR